MDAITPLPGAGAHAPDLKYALCTALAAKGSSYRPRTRHLNPDGSPRYLNRLLLEPSPYLLQHAHNPVDWHPWGAEAFAKAQLEDKPIFLSSGYSTCHWCHVMEEECFEDEEIAALLNRYFVAVKLDREQRPDVDSLYMHAVQLLTGHGGWPLSVFLTPDGKPFFGGTYFPPESFKQLLLQITDAWAKRRAEIEAQADRVMEAIVSIHATGQGGAMDTKQIQNAIAEILSQFDPRHGGFGTAPKFPNEPWLCLLIDELWRSYDSNVHEVVTKTLTSMALGGIYDQIGGGFHRYSVDSAWQVPHFEKMLYNQAQLSRIYAQAHLLTGDRFFARVAQQTFDYVLRELTAPEGGFYAATDADSEGEEGRFFLWTPAQIKAVLPDEEAELAILAFGVTERGNFEGRNVLHLLAPPSELASRQQMGEEELLRRLDGICQKLYAERVRRIPPLR
ncbi:MAG: thioredoxin domain-containing protein, partial [Methylohalobius sp.]|nr:thioredoxin domain-containing protein [Methylohalobius sp.]